MDDDPIATVRHELRVACRPGGVAVLTGAGMSAESGIATFRDARGSAPTTPPSPLHTPTGGATVGSSTACQR